jgi:hypothetical protein
MPTNNISKVSYKREKGKIEITGEGNDVIRQVWFDLIFSKFIYLVELLILVSFTPKISLTIFTVQHFRGILKFIRSIISTSHP